MSNWFDPLESATTYDVFVPISSQGFQIVCLYAAVIFAFVFCNEAMHFWDWLRSGRRKIQYEDTEDEDTEEEEDDESKVEDEEESDSDYTEDEEESDSSETEDYEDSPSLTLKRRRCLRPQSHSKRRQIVPASLNFSLDEGTRLVIFTSEPSVFSPESVEDIPTFIVTLGDSEEDLSSTLEDIHSASHGVVITDLPRIDLLSWATHFAIDFYNGGYQGFARIAIPHYNLEDIEFGTFLFFAKYDPKDFENSRELLSSPPLPYFTWQPQRDLRWIVHSPALKERLIDASSRFVKEDQAHLADLIFFDPTYDARPSSTSHPGLSYAFDWCVRNRSSLVFRPHAFPHYMYF